MSLPTASPRWVIDGSITNVAGGCQVQISQTANFNSNNQFPGFSSALVTIWDDSGDTTLLLPTSPGLYTAPDLVARIGVTYYLQVIIGQDTIHSHSTLPVEVNFDSLYITQDLLFGSTWTLANVAFIAPTDIDHYFQWIQAINGVHTQQIYTANNQLTAGRPQDVKLFMSPNTDDKDKIYSGDSVRVEMQCLDSAAYAFWFSASQSSTGNNQNAQPSNPVTNLVGNALGCFSAHTSQIRTVKAP